MPDEPEPTQTTEDLFVRLVENLFAQIEDLKRMKQRANQAAIRYKYE